MRCWTSSTRGHPQHVLILLRQRIQVGTIQTQASLDENYIHSVPSRWKRATQWELARFFVTGPTYASTKLSEFYCRLCRKDVSVLTHGSSEVLRHLQGIRRFARDQRLRLETPGWRVFGFDGKPLTEDELERQREKILRAPWVVRDREYPFREDFIPDALGNTDPQLLVLAKVSSLVGVFQLGGSYELVERLWELFVLLASRVNVSVGWLSNEVLVSCKCPPEHMCRLLVTCLLILLF